MAQANKPGAGASPRPEDIDYSRQGVTFRERILAKAFANHPEDAARWLQSLGYNAHAFKSGLKLQVAVQNRQTGAWGVLDPSGFEWQDLTDLIPDIIQTGLVEAATIGGGAAGLVGGAAMGAGAGGPVGVPPGMLAGGTAGLMLGGAAGGGGVETARQMIGRKLGINNEMDVEQILGQAIAGGAAPVLGPMLGRSARGVGKVVFRSLSKADELTAGLAKQLLTRLAGLKSPADLSVAIARRELDNPKSVIGTGEVLNSLRDNLLAAQRWTGESLDGPVQKAKSILRQYGVQNVPLKDVFDNIGEALREINYRFTSPARENAFALAKKMVDELMQYMHVERINGKPTAFIDLENAFGRKLAYQEQTDYTPGMSANAANVLYKAAGRGMRTAIEKTLPIAGSGEKLLPLPPGVEGSGGPRAAYIALMRDASDKYEKIGKLLPRIKAEAGTAPGPESFLRQVNNPGRSEARTALEDFNRAFPQLNSVDFADQAKLALISEALQSDKTAFSATGNILGPTLGKKVVTPIASTIAGNYLGGPIGAVIGGGLGTAAAFKPVQTGRMLAAINEPLAQALDLAAQASAKPAGAVEKSASRMTVQGAGRIAMTAASERKTPPAEKLAPNLTFDISALRARPDFNEIVAEVNALPGLDDETRLAALGTRLAEPPALRSARRKLQAGVSGSTAGLAFTPEETAALKAVGVDVSKLPQAPAQTQPARK